MGKRKSKGDDEIGKPAAVEYQDNGRNVYRAVIRSVALTGQERHYVLCLRSGVPDGFPPEQAIKLNESITEKCSAALVSFPSLLAVMGCGDLEMAACLARGIRYGDDRDKAFFARLILDRDRGEGKKRPKGTTALSPRPTASATARALEANDGDLVEVDPPLPTA